VSVDSGGTFRASGPAVIDASAVLAWLRDEPGADTVAGRLDGSFLSAVNLSEVLQKHLAVGTLPDRRRPGLPETSRLWAYPSCPSASVRRPWP
jgi:hypothetical protein